MKPVLPKPVSIDKNGEESYSTQQMINMREEAYKAGQVDALLNTDPSSSMSWQEGYEAGLNQHKPALGGRDD
jgi:hypothetical protein